MSSAELSSRIELDRNGSADDGAVVCNVRKNGT